jgi:hypothetical protein
LKLIRVVAEALTLGTDNLAVMARLSSASTELVHQRKSANAYPRNE